MNNQTNNYISGNGQENKITIGKLNWIIDEKKQQLDMKIILPVKSPIIRTAHNRLMDALLQPAIKPLAGDIWKTNELALLFADTGAGKTILAVQICDRLSRGEKVLIFDNDNLPLKIIFYDFELTDRQFLKRYSDNNSNLYKFSDNFLIDNVDFVSLYNDNPKEKLETILFNKFRSDIEYHKPDIIVIDNLTYLNSQTTQDTQIALEVMRRLNDMKKAYNLSILAIAHTPKRNQAIPLNKNDLAGSKHLSNFADSVFAIGLSNADSNLRYIKQIKPSRSGEMIYDSNNVITCELIKEDNFTHFDFIKFSPENDHLKEVKDSEVEETKLAIKNMHKNGNSIREIARELNIGKSTVQRRLKEIADNTIE